MVVEHVRRRMGHQRQRQRGQRPWPGQLGPAEAAEATPIQAAHKVITRKPGRAMQRQGKPIRSASAENQRTTCHSRNNDIPNMLSIQ